MPGLPSALLFACTMNSVRSPLAEALARDLVGHRIYVASVGIKAGEPDPFVAAVLREIGVASGELRPKTFAELDDAYFDLVVTLSALVMARSMVCDVESWPTFDATAVEGSREMKLDAYRAVRDGLFTRINARFGLGSPEV